MWRVVQTFLVAYFHLAAPRGERSGATTLPLRPPCQFAHSPLHTHTATRGRRVRELAFPLSRRSWRRFSHAPPTLSAFGETANQRHDSCSSRSAVCARFARNCRAAASQIRLGALPPAPAPLTPKHSSGTLPVACAITSARFPRRHAGCRSRVIATHSSRQPACRPPRLTKSLLRKSL